MNLSMSNILLGCYLLFGIAIALLFDGTGENGDSVQHFLAAKYSWTHPELFFDHWSKPVFVLLASPWAQFGFIGIKIFQVLIVTATMWFTREICQHWKFHHAWIVILLLAFCPLYIILTFSGLTEPLFALGLVSGIYLSIKKEHSWSAFLISLLPFIRSEGLIIAGVFGLYFLYFRKWKALPLLAAGHLIFSAAGTVVHGDPLWVFNRIPYSNVGSPYGSGGAFHFIEQLPYVVGIPIFILFCIGLIRITIDLARKWQLNEFHFLVVLNLLAFIGAHSVFWSFGIFNSMGLKRVLIGVIPLLAIVAFKGLEQLSDFRILKPKIRLTITASALLLCFVFLFSKSPASIDWSTDLSLTQRQKGADFMAGLIRFDDELPRFFYNDPYLNIALNRDPFNRGQVIELNKGNYDLLSPGDLIIWDDWFSVTERQIQLEDLEGNSNLRRWKAPDQINTPERYVVFEVVEKP